MLSLWLIVLDVFGGDIIILKEKPNVGDQIFEWKSYMYTGAEAGRALCGHLPPQTFVKSNNFNNGSCLYLLNFMNIGK